MVVSVSVAKMDLSKLVNLAYQGEVITITKNNLPLVDMVVHKKHKKTRPIGLKFGVLEGKVPPIDDSVWFEPDKEIEDAVYNNSIFPDE